MPPPMRRRPVPTIPKPKNIKEVPGYLKKVLGGFFYRFFYILRLVWETSPAMMIALVFMAIVSGVLPVVGAHITAELVQKISVLFNMETLVDYGSVRANISANFAPVMLLLIANFAYIFFNQILNRVNHIITNLAGERVVNHIRLTILSKAKNIDLASYDRPEFYEKMENANREVGHRPIQIMNATFNLVTCLISSVSFIVILVGFHPAAPWLMLLLALPTTIVNFIFRNRNFWYMRWHSRERRQMDYFANVVVDKDRVKEMRLMNLSDTFIDRYRDAFKTYYKGLRRLILREGFWQIAVTLFSIVGHCALFFFVAYSLIYRGGGTLGQYTLYTTALTSIGSYVSSFIGGTATIYEGTLFIDNLIVFIKEKQTVVPQTPTPEKPKRHVPHTFVFEHVSFRYPGTERDVISDFSCTFAPGETVVLVGLNGAGKTTLIKLMTRLYDPTEGRILLDGVDLRDYDTEALYDLFGIIFQDFGKYAVSVRENIAFGDIDRPGDDEAVRLAARQSDSEEFISRLPGGYDTPLMRYFEQDGIELSIGQWQKLSVARAFYKDSDVLILDEPTASLDAMAEQAIYDQFAGLSKDKTTVFVSHRLSSATTASKIVVLEYGRLVETGTHEELMSKKGKYYELFSTQARRYLTHTEQEELASLAAKRDHMDNHRGHPDFDAGADPTPDVF
ncbi:MAG: ABC transporter ATP-binding protein [Clostridia bacterium]|nr:ABC transporter ATP-binding protein [Clostridia bacterium]